MLLVRNFSSQLTREDIQDSLEHEFRKFGDVSIKVSRDHNGERIAYATFRNPDDARDCKNAKGHLVMYDRRLSISVANDEPPDERYTRERSPYSRDTFGTASPVMTRSPPPRRRSPKRMQGRQRNYQQRERSNYNERNERYSPRPRPPRSRRVSDERTPVRNRFSSQGSSIERSPVRRDSTSKEATPMSTNDTQSTNRRRSSSKESTPVKRSADGASDGNPTSTNAAGPPTSGASDSNNFPQSGFMEKTIPPEDDPFATRTLFVGNLELDVSIYDLRRVFGEFGDIVDIDVKRSPRHNGSYCFIKFANLNQAYKAKVTLNGKVILKNVARIGYGKVMYSPKIWIGGLGDWTTMADLEREFDRFGSIRKIDFRRGDDSATILYETVDAAQAACNQMRGFLMPNAETRLRMDFVDAEGMSHGHDGFQDWNRHDNTGSSYGQGSNDRYPNKYKNNSSRYRGRNVFVDDRKQDRRRHSRSRSPRGRRKDGKHKSSIHEAAMTELQMKRFHAKSCYTMHDLCQVFDPPCWQGGFVLKKIAFPVLFFLLDGDMGILNTTTADPNSPTGRQTMFHVNQRLRMTEDNMKEINKRMKYIEGKCCLMVCVPGVPENLNMSGTISGPMPTQHKPLRGLVKYFKEKEAAAIISVPLITLKKDKDAENEKEKKEVSGFIHAFPPSPFTHEQLLKVGPNLQPQFFADDYLFAILVKGSSSVLL